MTNLDSISKSRGITFLTKVHIVQAMVFPVVMYGYESWTIKKTEHQKIDAFELWCWKRLESPLDCKEIQPVNPKGNQSWIYQSWSSNTLATWCKELTHWKQHWCWERLKAGGEGDDRGWDSWMASPTQWTWVWASFGSWWWTGKPGMLQSMGLQRTGLDWVTELNNYLLFTPLFNHAMHLSRTCCCVSDAIWQLSQWAFSVTDSVTGTAQDTGGKSWTKLCLGEINRLALGPIHLQTKFLGPLYLQSLWFWPYCCCFCLMYV